MHATWDSNECSRMIDINKILYEQLSCLVNIVSMIFLYIWRLATAFCHSHLHLANRLISLCSGVSAAVLD